MNEFGITKIMDGIFISDLSLIYVRFTSFRINNSSSKIKFHISLHGQLKISKSVKINCLSNYLNAKKTVLMDCYLIKISWVKFFRTLKNQNNNVCVVWYAVIFNLRQQCFYQHTSLKSTFKKLLRFNWDLKTTFNFLTLRF